LVGAALLGRDVGVDHRLAVAVPAPSELPVAAARVEGIPGKVEVVALAVAVKVGGGRAVLDDGVSLCRAVQGHLGVAQDVVDPDRAVRLAVPALLGLFLEGQDRRVAVGELLVGGGGGERRRSHDRGRDQPERGYGGARPQVPVYGVMRIATSYRSTPVRRPGVSPVGMALRISSPRR
jgi:hypothetical protein